MAKKDRPKNILEEAFKVDDHYRAIGRFIFQFSQLELTIRHALTSTLDLKETLSDPITAPYDFATLCRVTKTVMRDWASADPDICKAVDKVFKDCLRLNEQRVRIAHGTWLLGNVAIHVSRRTFKASEYFDSSEDIEREADEAQRLMGQVSKIMYRKPKQA
jgi:hypothetical protein